LTNRASYAIIAALNNQIKLGKANSYLEGWRDRPCETPATKAIG
jgi:hypothetical protein